jgi:threonine synthase
VTDGALLVNDLECIRCAQVWPVAEYPYGCPACAEAGRNSNLFCRYDGPGRLPYAEVPQLGQGDTPLLEFDWLPGVYVKNEAANPTGSHKDRFAASVVAHALALGRERVVIGSSGNAGLSLAAYAAFTELRCAVSGFTYLPDSIRTWVTAFGAELHLFDSDAERTGWVRGTLCDPGTLPVSNLTDPAIGSHVIGIEGYKAVAHEILRETAVDHVVVPSSRGDLAWGMFLGFREAGVIPRLHLVEPVPRLSAVLAGRAALTDHFDGDAEGQFSISGDTTTVQAHRAVTLSGGTAHVVDGTEATDWAHRIARRGLGLERSSAGVFAVHERLTKSKIIEDGETTALIATSNFYKGL